MKRTFAVLCLCVWSLLAGAAGVEPRPFDDPAEEARYRSLIAELRCLVCQNQSLAESDASLAKDLRDQTYQMVLEGRSNQEVVSFMVGRYGDFVLYRPPVQSTTALLWFGPLLLLGLGAALVFLQVRRRARQPAEAQISPEDEKRAQALLAGPADKS